MFFMTGHTHSPYLEDIPLDEALARWFAALAQAGLDRPLAGESVALEDAAGRVTAEPVWALISSPHYHAAAMDGYAVRAEETRGASETRPVHLTIGQQAFYVDTGDPLPPGTNAVIMVEDVQVQESANQQIGKSANHESRITNHESVIRHIEILATVAPWQHVRPMGEDMVATELILPANQRLRPQDIGAAAGAGHARLAVRRKPRVAILPTGTELVPPGSNVRPGDIIEYNSLVLAAMIGEWGAAPTRLAPLSDDYAAIRARVVEAAQTHDLVIVNAGSSAGSEDFTARIIAELGQVLVHGIAIRPGHPVILGMIQGTGGRSQGRSQESGVRRGGACRSCDWAAGLSGVGRDHVRAAGEAHGGALAGPTGRGTRRSDGSHHPQGRQPGRGRGIPARDGGPGGGAAGCHPAARRLRRSDVAGAGRRHRAHPARRGRLRAGRSRHGGAPSAAIRHPAHDHRHRQP